MKSHIRRAGVAALTLVVCLAFSPVATAKPIDGPTLREKIIQIVKKLRTFAGTKTFEDFPAPPKP